GTGRGGERGFRADAPGACLSGGAWDQLEQAVAGADVPGGVGLEDEGRARAADAGVDDAEKRGPRRKPFGIGGQQVGRCLGIAGRRIGEEVDRRYARHHLVQHRLHLTRVGTVQAEIREQRDHVLARVRPASRNNQAEFSRRPRGAQRARRAVKDGSGDAGRYARSFGLSASLASPPCGEWKAYRVTAAIARKSIQAHGTRSISVARSRMAPRAGFEPATNRLTVVFNSMYLQRGASTCATKVI